MLSFINYLFSSQKNDDEEYNVHNCGYHLYSPYNEMYDEHEQFEISYKIYSKLVMSELDNPTFEEIDKLLIASNYYLQYDHRCYNELIQMAPDKFLLAYANNFERIILIIDYLNKYNPQPVNRILSYMNDGTKLYIIHSQS